MIDNSKFTERQLTIVERETTAWLLKHGNPHASVFASQIDEATVVGDCGCGCASVNFAIRGVHAEPGGLQILSDYYWIDKKEYIGGIFVFAVSGQLAGIEVYAIDGKCDVSLLPEVSLLIPLPEPDNDG